jgi:hypothetical protein
MNQPDGKTLGRMQKLLELTRRGVGGEAANAERFLAKMLTRHGMRLSDIESIDQQRSKVQFKYRTSEDQMLLWQIITKVRDQHDVQAWGYRGKKLLIVELSPAEHAEVLVHHAVLAPAMEAHMKRARTAFMHANQLFPASAKRDKESCKPIDERELEAIMKMIAVTDPVKVHKALTAPKSTRAKT